MLVIYNYCLVVWIIVRNTFRTVPFTVLLYYYNNVYRLAVDNYIQTYQQPKKVINTHNHKKPKKFPLYRKNTLKYTHLVILHNSYTMLLCRCYNNKESYKKGFTELQKRTIIQLPQGRKPKRHGITVYIVESRWKNDLIWKKNFIGLVDRCRR